jgi:hypothetical protein
MTSPTLNLRRTVDEHVKSDNGLLVPPSCIPTPACYNTRSRTHIQLHTAFPDCAALLYLLVVNRREVNSRGGGGTEDNDTSSPLFPATAQKPGTRITQNTVLKFQQPAAYIRDTTATLDTAFQLHYDSGAKQELPDWNVISVTILYVFCTVQWNVIIQYKPKKCAFSKLIKLKLKIKVLI